MIIGRYVDGAIEPIAALRAEDGWIVGDCACGGVIRVRPDADDGAIFEAAAEHNASLLHRKARKRWEAERNP